MRKTMTKEVTKTTVKVAKMIVGKNGLPEAEQLPDEILIGNVSLEKAQKEVNKKYDFQVTVFGVEPTTELYRMAVEDFIRQAELVTPEEAAASEAAEQAEEAASETESATATA